MTDAHLDLEGLVLQSFTESALADLATEPVPADPAATALPAEPELPHAPAADDAAVAAAVATAFLRFHGELAAVVLAAAGLQQAAAATAAIKAGYAWLGDKLGLAPQPSAAAAASPAAAAPQAAGAGAEPGRAVAVRLPVASDASGSPGGTGRIVRAATQDEAPGEGLSTAGSIGWGRRSKDDPVLKLLRAEHERDSRRVRQTTDWDVFAGD